jgi:hypothetical protein
MPVYVYETIPADAGASPRQFELRQSMNDRPLTHDPESGLPVRRLIQGGYLNTQRWTKSPGAALPAAPAGGGNCCGISGCGPH